MEEIKKLVGQNTSKEIQRQTENEFTKKISISKYESHYSKEKSRYVPGCIPQDTDLYLELTRFKDGYYEDQINKMLSLPTEDEQKAYKQQYLTSLTFSVRCKNWRKLENVLERIGCVGIDIDGQDNEHITDWHEMRNQIVKDMGGRLVAAFLSARKKGLFLILRIDPKLHLKTFNFISYSLKEKYGLYIDPSGKDETRLRFVTHDPDGYINFDWDNIPVIIPTDEYLRKQRELKRDTPRPKALKVSKADTPELFKNAIKKAEYDFKIETGNDFEFTPGSRHRILVAIAGYCNVRGMDMNYCIDQVRSKYHYDGYDTSIAIKNVYKSYKDQHGSIDVNDYGDEDLATRLQDFNLKRNEITRKIEWDGEPMEQRHFNTIFLEIRKTFPRLSYDLLERTICSNLTPSYNPLKEFFESYAYRKSTGLIKALSETIETDTGFCDSNFFPDYKYHFLKKWLISIVASVYGEHSYLMMVLSGNKQGTGKTEFFRRLLPTPLRWAYAESKLDAGKDDEILMCIKLLISDDEFGGKSKKDEKRIKEVLSKDYFTLREPYGRHNVDLKRLAVLCGTTNDHEILSDPTGNRRIIPINVLSINHEAYNAIDKTDLFLEAYHLYKEGFNWHLSYDDIKLLNSNTSDFEQTSAEKDLISKFFGVPEDEDTRAVFMTATEIKSRLETTNQKLNPTRLGIELKKMGFIRYSKSVNGIKTKGYNVIDLSIVGGQVDSRLTALVGNRQSIYKQVINQ